ncbi:MAG: peptidase S10 [Gemmatimonadetes bacterium]|nr:peptidase S10 [Gemmatimonadota bacterium]
MRSPMILAAALLLRLASPSAALAAAPDTLPVPDPVRFETRHSGTFNGRQIAYRAVVGDVQLKREDGGAYASLFTTAYLAEGVDDPSARPVTFVFNGGPGSASVWLHLGLFGPKRVVLPSDARNPGGPPYAFEPNGSSPLDLTDLVFIDPAGTGFSRLVGDGKPEDVYGLREDARSIAQLIREWLRANRRWTSPVFLAGESFGTTRAAALLPQLMGGSEPLAVSGVILISQALDYQGSTPTADNTTSFVTYLPTMAATAWYHGKVERGARTLEQFLDEVRRFATDTYLPALVRGSTLGEAETRRVAAQYAAYTGLDVEYVLRARLQVEAGRFLKELLRDRGVAVGRLDGRYVADEVDDLAERPSFDAASAATSAAYSTVLHEYLAGDLGVTRDRPYHVSGPDVNRNWVWNRASPGGEPRYVNTAPDLAWAMSYNPGLRVFLASGYYDYATPFFDAEYTFARHGIALDRVRMTYYEAGHMMYLHQPSFEAVSRDIHAFIGEVRR